MWGSREGCGRKWDTSVLDKGKNRSSTALISTSQDSEHSAAQDVRTGGKPVWLRSPFLPQGVVAMSPMCSSRSWLARPSRAWQLPAVPTTAPFRESVPDDLENKMFCLKSTARCYITQMQDLWSAYEVHREQTQRKEERNKKQTPLFLLFKKSKEKQGVFVVFVVLVKKALSNLEKRENLSTGYAYDGFLLDENSDPISRRSNSPWS